MRERCVSAPPSATVSLMSSWVSREHTDDGRGRPARCFTSTDSGVSITGFFTCRTGLKEAEDRGLAHARISLFAPALASAAAHGIFFGGWQFVSSATIAGRDQRRCCRLLGALTLRPRAAIAPSRRRERRGYQASARLWVSVRLLRDRRRNSSSLTSVIRAVSSRMIRSAFREHVSPCRPPGCRRSGSNRMAGGERLRVGRRSSTARRRSGS